MHGNITYMNVCLANPVVRLLLKSSMPQPHQQVKEWYSVDLKLYICRTICVKCIISLGHIFSNKLS